jgi:hypothetical protein
MKNGSMFSTKNLQGGSAWILLIIGIIAYVMGYGVIKDPIWNSISIKIGDVFIIGCVIGYLTNAARFLNLFKQDLQDIIYGKEFISKRRDIDSVWENLSKLLFKNKFPKIHKELLQTTKEYFPKDEISYYDDYETHIVIEWVNKETGIIKTTDNVSFNLITVTTEEFVYPMKTWTTTNDIVNVVTKIKVNGKEPDCVIDADPQKDKEGSVCQEKRIKLRGSTKYKIEYTREKTYSIRSDYYIGFRAKYITTNLRACIDLPEGIEALFICRGTQKDFDEVSVNNNKNRIERKYKGIVLPRQGYIFALRESVSERKN